MKILQSKFSRTILFVCVLMLGFAGIGTTSAYAADSVVEISEANFPDANFRTWITENITGADDGILTAEELAAVTQMNVSGQGIASLVGIEHFTVLTSLDCQNNHLTSLDLSKNTKLTTCPTLGQTATIAIDRQTMTYTMPAGFNSAKASNVTGGGFSGAVLTVDEGATEVTYTYSASLKFFTMTVTLTVENPHAHAFDEATHECECGATNHSFDEATHTCSCGAANHAFDEATHECECGATNHSFDEATHTCSCGATNHTFDEATHECECGATNHTFDEATHECPCGAMNHSFDETTGVCACGAVYIDARAFPDENFRAAVRNGAYHTKHDFVLTTAELAAVRNLSLSMRNITSLAGIEHFTALTYLDCQRNQLTSLDLSKNTALTYLDCRENQLTSLDLSKNTALTYLNCLYNNLTSLDLSADANITDYDGFGQTSTVTIDEKTMTASLPDGVDASKVTVQFGATLNGNVLTVEEGAEGLVYIYEVGDMNRNVLTVQLNITNPHTHDFPEATHTCTCGATNHSFDAETYVCACGAIEVNIHTFPDENFRNWILAQTYGTDGILSAEEIATVQTITVYNYSISNLKGIEHFIALTNLNCGNNQLTSLDVSKNTALTKLYCEYNQLESLDVSKNTALTELNCQRNQLTNLDVSKNTALTKLYCGNNQLGSLDVSQNTALTELYCQSTQLKNLDVSKNTALTGLLCNNNQLTSLDLSNCLFVDTFNGSEQSASITVDRNVLSASLPTGVSAANVTSVSGATLNGDVLENITGDSITYTYATGKTGCDLSVTLSVTYTGQLVVNAEVSQVSVTLDGDIGVNFYWTLGDTAINDSTAYFLVILPNGDTEKIMVSDAPKGTPIGSSTEYYKISGYVAAKEMAKDIVVEFYAGGELVESANCSVRGYAERVFAYSEDAELIAMMKAMLNYGAASQVLFEYKTDDLANSVLEDSDKTVVAVTENDVTAAVVSGSVSGITNIEFSCILETKTTLRHYFSLTEGNIADYTFEVGGATVTPIEVVKDSKTVYYVDIPNISAKDLGVTYAFTITKGNETQTISASVQSYMSSVIRYSDDTNLIDAVNAMYAYNQSAIAYFSH